MIDGQKAFLLPFDGYAPCTTLRNDSLTKSQNAPLPSHKSKAKTHRMLAPEVAPHARQREAQQGCALITSLIKIAPLTPAQTADDVVLYSIQ